MDAKEVYTSFNPITGENLGEYPVQSRAEICECLSLARIAQHDWRQVPLKHRIWQVRQIGDYILEHIDEIADDITRANHKSRVDSLVTEVFSSLIGVSYYCKQASRYLQERRLPLGSLMFFNKRSKVVRVPWGVVGIIAPWNYPWAIPFAEIIMALLAGNAVLFKTATQTLLVGAHLKRAVAAAALPPGLFQHIIMPGPLLGEALLEEGIDKIFFTGSVAVGKLLMKKAADTLTPLSLELGGNDPMIVCADANLPRAVNGAIWAGLQNAGQTCGGVERVYVHESLYPQFLEQAKVIIETLRIGPGESFACDIGAMTTAQQAAKVKAQVEEAIAAGATIYASSPVPEGLGPLFLSALLLIGVNHSMRIMQEETFGPVLAVMPFREIDEAITLANDSFLGLTASVWSRNRKAAEQIGRRLEAGVITLNDHALSHAMPQTPWGGFKQSGIGRTRGKEGFDEMTQPQVIIDERLPWAVKNVWWHPYSETLYNGIKGGMVALYARGWRRRLIGLRALLRIAGRMFKG